MTELISPECHFLKLYHVTADLENCRSAGKRNEEISVSNKQYESVATWMCIRDIYAVTFSNSI